MEYFIWAFPVCSVLVSGGLASRQSNHVSINIVMYSLEDDESIINNAIASGAKDYILKPISTDAILNVVKKYINNK